MTVKKDTLVQRVQAAYPRLSAAAQSLNEASDGLGKAVSELDEALRKLGLGVTSWTPFSGGGNAPFEWSHDVGYTKINGRWCLAIRTASYGPNPEDDDIEQWPFNEAPRVFRVQAAKLIPDLFEQLAKDAEQMTKTVAASAEEITSLTEAIKQVAEDKDGW